MLICASLSVYWSVVSSVSIHLFYFSLIIYDILVILCFAKGTNMIVVKLWVCPWQAVHWALRPHVRVYILVRVLCMDDYSVRHVVLRRCNQDEEKNCINHYILKLLKKYYTVIYLIVIECDVEFTRRCWVLQRQRYSCLLKFGTINLIFRDIWSMYVVLHYFLYLKCCEINIHVYIIHQEVQIVYCYSLL